MLPRRFAFVIGIFAILFIGCAVRPQMDFYLSPVTEKEEQKVDEKTGAVTVEHEGVSITVTAMDIKDLLKVTSDARINPYIYVSDWGTARSLYTVFDVSVKNNRDSKVSVDPNGAILMDEQGEQYEVIPYEKFKERYPAYPVLEREIVYYPPFPPYYRYGWRYPWYYHYDRYWWYYRPYPYYRLRTVFDTAYLKRSVARGTLLTTVKLFPGGKKQGFIVFPRLAEDAGELKLIIPGVTIYLDDKEERLEFQFNFKQLPVKKGKQ